jgi:signal transduction histidine kinase
MAHDLRLSQMRSDFVASVSHELKTPLAKIQLFAETLESGRVRSPEKAASYYRVMSVYSKKLSLLIGQLLDFSKLEAGVRHYPLEELDLCAVLKGAMETFEYELTRDKFTVEVEMPDMEVLVSGNGEGLLQLFSNLIGNAVKYSPDERFLRVRLAVAGARARVEITDRGIGIARKEHRQIFKKFYRGENTNATALMGSGIGLAIAEDVVRGHNGTISVTSVPGEGSTFAVELPLASDSSEGHDEEGSGDRGRRRTVTGVEG